VVKICSVIQIKLTVGLKKCLSYCYLTKALVSCAIIACNYFSARRPSGAKMIACNNFSTWFRVQLLHAVILGFGRGNHCQSVCVMSLQKCPLTKS